MVESELKINALVCSVLIIILYAFYSVGNLVAYGEWPDGLLFGGVASTVVGLFGYASGYFKGVRKVDEEEFDNSV